MWKSLGFYCTQKDLIEKQQFNEMILLSYLLCIEQILEINKSHEDVDYHIIFYRTNKQFTRNEFYEGLITLLILSDTSIGYLYALYEKGLISFEKNYGWQLSPMTE